MLRSLALAGARLLVSRLPLVYRLLASSSASWLVRARVRDRERAPAQASDRVHAFTRLLLVRLLESHSLAGLRSRSCSRVQSSAARSFARKSLARLLLAGS